VTEPLSDPVYSAKLTTSALVRRFVSRHGRGYLAIGIVGGDGNPVDPTAGTLTLRVYRNLLDDSPLDPRGDLIIDVTADALARDDVGKFHYDIGPQWTDQRGLLTAEWAYEVDGVAFAFTDNMQILDQMPTFDRLREDSKLIVEQASWFVADLFDSTTGGPWLAENFQTHFDYERIAFLVSQAVMRFNVLGFPVTNYGVDVGSATIPANFSALMIWATKLEIIRHLILSYTEQPTFQSVQTTFTDRRDYAQRWQAVLAEEKPDFEKAVKLSKRSLLKLGRGSLLVSGGIYGGGAQGLFRSGMYAAQTRAWRFYPAAPSVSFGNQAFGSPR
jgi:hypothetical protein